LGVAFAGGATTEGVGREFKSTGVTVALLAGGKSWNEERFMEK
jgi:hypothetical protein